jgi:hypothetical protein
MNEGGIPMVRCNNCYRQFEDDSALTKLLHTVLPNGMSDRELYDGRAISEHQEVFDGCPDCLTDEFLMDIDRIFRSKEMS